MDMNLANAIAQGIAAALGDNKSYGFKAPGTTPGTNVFHGAGGMFGIAGLDNQVISARITPRGISAYLPVYPAVDTNPLFPFITGVEENAGDEPSVECATCLSGEYEACLQTAAFGRVCRETQTIAANEVMDRINKGEVDLQLVNDILGFQGDSMAAIRNYDRNRLLQMATAQGMLLIGILLQQKLVPMWWTGNPANNIGTGYAECPGLDLLISTGKVDAITNTTCPALDSDVKEYGYNNVNTADGAGNFMIVRYMEYMEAYLYHNASRQNLGPVDTAVVMRPELWYELTNIWPIAYLTTRNITLPAGNTNFIDSSRVRDMMDEMREGQFLFLNGRRHPVILDDGILELNSANDANVPAGSFASNIYFVPLTYMGGRPGTFLQHKDYRGAQADINMAHLQDELWTDDGRFMWTVERVKWCYTLSGKVEPRIILKVPQLAGRINHVMYTPLQHFRSFDQDSDYFFKGGVSERTPSTYYSEWQSQ